MPQEFYVPASRGYRKRKLRLFVKRFFSEPRWLYSCLKSQKTISDYYFNSNNYCNRTSAHIIKTELPRDIRLTSQGEKYYSKVWNLRYDESMLLKCMEFIVCYFLVALESQILYIYSAFAS